MTFRVRTAAASDTAAIDALLARAYPRLLRPDYPASVLVTALPLISRAQPALILSGTCYVAEDAGGRIIGAGGWTTALRGGSATAGNGRANVRHIVTDDRAVRRGVGRAIVTRALDEARAAGMVWMRCLSTRTAVPFYRAIGFAELGPVTIPLAPGIEFPAVDMRRDL